MPHSFTRDLFYSAFPGNAEYLSFGVGETNVILSAPHGGGIKPVNSIRRRYGNRSQDQFTRRLIQKILSLLDKKPYYVYADIHRSVVDLNRDIVEAAQGNKLAEQVWTNWNNLLDTYTDRVRKGYRSGLYIDIHSHNNSDMFELGYNLRVKDYLLIKDHKDTDAKSSMYTLKNSQYEMMFGDSSFSSCIELHGYKVLVPENDKNYLNGGYNIKKFSGNKIGAIQIECPISILRKDLDGVARTLTNSIEIFKERFLDD